MIKRTTLFFVFLFVLFYGYSYAQVNVGATPYTTLKAAFDAINAGTHTGALTITISGNTTESASAVLNASGTGSANYTSISISPTGGAGRTISGNFTGYVVDLNGADNVTIDGLNTGGNSLTISNAATGASGALRLYNDATSNVITNCTITGSTSSTVDGVIYIGTGAVTGNDNNTISNSTIGATGTNLPNIGIQAVGTSAAIDNANITITGCNIQDYFSATTASYGMSLGLGSNAWIITNNKFFQTGTRTYTTANTHSAIIVFNGAGYNVSGNTIGFANAGGTGTYTMTSTVATRFVGINMSAGTTATVNSIQGNTMAGISLTTSSGATTLNGILCGVFMGAGNFNIGNITPNIFGSTTGSGSWVATPTTTQGAVVGIAVATTGTVVIQNNQFGGMSSSGTTAAVAGGLFGVYVGTNAPTALTITGNTFGNSVADNMRGGTLGLTTGNSIVAGINYALTTGTTAVSITNNTFQNFSSYGTGTSGYVRGIWTGAVSGATITMSITGNTFNNFNVNATNTTLSNGTAMGQGIGIGFGLNTVISGNTISNINGLNTGTGGYTVVGIGLGNATSTKVSNNIIYGLTNASTSTTVTAPGIAAGVCVRSSTTSDTIVNNMITLGSGQTTNTSFIGIYLNHGSTPDPANNIFYNTISISGTVTSGAQPSFGIVRGDFSVTARAQVTVIKNNILDNSRTGGTGKHYAISNNYGATTPSATGWTSDYNVLNSASASTVGFWTTDQTLVSWRSTSSGDVASLSAVPITYTNAAAGNLRLNMGLTPTQLESGATPISTVTTDIDGFARPKPGAVNGGGFAPDFGAGESDMVFLDASGPTITYTALQNTAGTGDRTLTATITDGSGVASGANVPRLYYKKSSEGSYHFDNAPTGSAPSYTWTISAAAMGGLSSGDVVQYYVAAQDLVGNLTTSPNGGSGTNPPGTTAPGSPNSYTVATGLSGTYTVGLTMFNRITGLNLYTEERTRKVVTTESVETDYVPVHSTGKESETASINAPNVTTREVVKDEKYSVLMQNGREYTGPKYHEISSQERIALGLTQDLIGVYTTITAAVADLNTRSTSGNTIFSLTDATYPTETFPLVININNVTLPGASSTATFKPATGVTSTISGSANSALIKILNNYIIIDGSNTPGGTTKDLTITNISVTTPSVIHLASTGTNYLNNVTIKNTICINGVNTNTAIVVSDALSGTAGYFSNITLQNNSIQKAYIGVYMIGAVGSTSFATVTGNDFTTSGANSIRFTGLYMQQLNGATVSQNSFANFDGTSAEDDRGMWLATGTTNTIVERNMVKTLKYTGTGGYGCYGVAISTATAACNNIVRCNQFCDLSGDGWVNTTLGDNTHGIYAFTTQTGLKFYNNSIYLSGNTLNQTGAMSYGITLGTGSTADIRNNSIVNNLGLLAATGLGSTCIFLQTGVSQLEAEDNNNYVCSPTGSGIKGVAYVVSTNYADLASYAALTAKDANSVSNDPAYISTTNLDIDTSNPNCWVLNGNGYPGLAPADYNGNVMSTGISEGPCDIGAISINPLVLPPNATQTGTIGVGNTTSYSIFGRTFASITWGPIGTYPGTLTVTYNSGAVPPSNPPSAKYGFGYWNFVPDVQPAGGGTYTITINFFDGQTGTVGSPSTNLILAKFNGLVWTDYQPGAGIGQSNLNYAAKTVSVSGLTSFSSFALTDKDFPLPVELASFTANVNRRDVELKWSTANEQNNSGFDIERKSASSQEWIKISSVAGAGNSTDIKSYSYSDRNILTGKYNYRLKQIDFNGNFKYYTLSNEVSVGIPNSFAISQNYPNPFNPSTKINYDLPFDSKVQIKIFDMTGREVAQVLNETKSAGYYTAQFNASMLSSGIYFYQINANGGNQSFVKTMKMVLVK